MYKLFTSLLIWPIWFAYTIFSLIIIFILILIIPSKKIYLFLRPICWLWCLFGGQFLYKKNMQPTKNSQPYIYMFNHCSMFDQFMIGAYVEHYLTAVAAIEIFKYPLWGHVLRKYGIIPIYRSKLKDALNSLLLAENKLKNGDSILIAPEGTRTTNGKLGLFKKGPFHLAKNSGATIIPVGLSGGFEAKKKTDWRIRPGMLSIKFGKPIYKQHYSKMSIDELSENVRNQVLKLIT
jgi:1-acyl-sn-glycerol-3-phosphate acyltransferase